MKPRSREGHNGRLKCLIGFLVDSTTAFFFLVSFFTNFSTACNSLYGAPKLLSHSLTSSDVHKFFIVCIHGESLNSKDEKNHGDFISQTSSMTGGTETGILFERHK